MPIRWDIQRNDELSGTGEGVVYQAELAPPLWKAEVTIQPVRLTEAQAISALVRGLGGALEPFMFRDPYICGPRLDPARRRRPLQSGARCCLCEGAGLRCECQCSGATTPPRPRRIRLA